jgi:hypothetical protein
MQACALFVQVDEAGPRFKVALGPNGSMHPPYAGALVYDSYRAQTMISAPRAIGDADFEMHDLKSITAFHRPYHTPVSPYPTLAVCLPTPHHHYHRPFPTPTPPHRRCGRHVTWENLIHSRGGREEAMAADDVLREQSSHHARGAMVRSLDAVVLNGLSICDHPNVGSLLWWARGFASRHAQRANMPLAAWAAANHLLPPAHWQAAAAVPGLAGMGLAAGAAAAAAAAAIAAAGAAGPVGAAGPAVAAAGGGDDASDDEAGDG